MDNLTSNYDLNLVKKLQHGLTAGGDELFQLILDPDSGFLQTLLKNPHLNEDHLLVLLKRRDLSEELINSIYRKNKQSLSHRIILALVKNPTTSGTLIRNLLPQLRLFELVDLINFPGATPDQKLAAERTLLQRLPTTPLGNKITLARRGTANIIGELLKEGQPQLFEVCLNNPQLKEAAIYQFLRGATASAETISMVARHNRWHQRPNLRLAILKNPKTPEIWFTLWLPKIHLHVLKQLAVSCRSNPAQKHLFEVELKNRGGI
ncbi:MAG: hypothetical protein L3J57_02915 [Desulfuromusa sp.]|nr:hypothetical protein [Desulfuromusa sp.]